MSTGSNLGNYNGTNTIALAGHTLTLSDASNSYGSSLDSVITDTGNILVSSGSWNFNAVSPNWSGNLNVASASAVNVVAGSLGTASVVEAAGGVIRVCAAGNTTLSNAFSLAQTGTVSAMGFGSCGAPTSSYTLTLSGALTLTSNVTVNSNGGSNTETFLITGPLSGAYTLTSETGSSAVVNIQSSNNTSNSPNTPAGGSSGIQTITYSDSQPGTSVTVANNQKVLVDGTRGNITVQSGGILGGHGTVGTVSVQSGGTLAPGNSPGCLASGNVTLVSGANYNVDIAGATACTEYDQEVVTGTVDLGSATLNLNLTYVPVAGAKFKIIDNDAADAIVGTFAGLTDGATVTANGYNFTISYLGGDGNDVELTAVGPVVVPALPAAAHSTGTAPILLALLAMLGVIGIEIGRRARARR
jgi:fibronectin-binding autotransporter adhesin